MLDCMSLQVLIHRDYAEHLIVHTDALFPIRLCRGQTNLFSNNDTASSCQLQKVTRWGGHWSCVQVSLLHCIGPVIDVPHKLVGMPLFVVDAHVIFGICLVSMRLPSMLLQLSFILRSLFIPLHFLHSSLSSSSITSFINHPLSKPLSSHKRHKRHKEIKFTPQAVTMKPGVPRDLYEANAAAGGPPLGSTRGPLPSATAPGVPRDQYEARLAVGLPPLGATHGVVSPDDDLYTEADDALYTEADDAPSDSGPPLSRGFHRALCYFASDKPLPAALQRGSGEEYDAASGLGYSGDDGSAAGAADIPSAAPTSSAAPAASTASTASTASPAPAAFIPPAAPTPPGSA